jgi:hypothetical protein
VIENADCAALAYLVVFQIFASAHCHKSYIFKVSGACEWCVQHALSFEGRAALLDP